MNPVLRAHIHTQAAQRVSILAHHFHPAYSVQTQLARTRAHYVAVFHANILVLELTPEFLAALGASSTAKHLLLSAQGAHIRTHPQHKHEAQEIIQTLPVALKHLRYVGRHDHVAVGESSMGRLLYVPIKFVPALRARTGQDEAWVGTAYFIRDADIRRLLQRRKLRPLRST